MKTQRVIFVQDCDVREERAFVNICGHEDIVLYHEFHVIITCFYCIDLFLIIIDIDNIISYFY